MNWFKKLWRKFLCFMSFHQMEVVEENVFAMIMTLIKRQCKHCSYPKFSMSSLFREMPLNQTKYEGLLNSMVRVSEVTKGTGAEHMTAHTCKNAKE